MRMKGGVRVHGVAGPRSTRPAMLGEGLIASRTGGSQSERSTEGVAHDQAIPRVGNLSGAGGVIGEPTSEELARVARVVLRELRREWRVPVTGEIEGPNSRAALLQRARKLLPSEEVIAEPMHGIHVPRSTCGELLIGGDPSFRAGGEETDTDRFEGLVQARSPHSVDAFRRSLDDKKNREAWKVIRVLRRRHALMSWCVAFPTPANRNSEPKESL